MKPGVSLLRLIALCAAALVTGAHAAEATPAPQGFEQLSRSLKSAAAGPQIPFARKASLSEAAVLLGARTGLNERACKLLGVIEAARAELDRKYRFSDLMMGAGVLPPVIDEARDNVALDAVVMRVASRVYRFSEAARLVDVPPTWRDWLLVGLPQDACSFDPAAATAALDSSVLPANETERAFWLAESRKAYDAGIAQANDTYEGNLNRLDRAYKGMRRYFDLYVQGMVSAPVIVAATDVAVREDANTLVVGNTIIRITVPSDFVVKPQAWRPLTQ